MARLMNNAALKAMQDKLFQRASPPRGSEAVDLMTKGSVFNLWY